MHWRTWAIGVGLLLIGGSTAALGFQDEAHGTPPATESHASEPAHATAAQGAHGDQGDFKPALLTFDPGAAIWSIIVFLVLLILLRAFAWKPILKVLKEREEFIQGSLDDAKREREEAERVLEKYTRQLEQARAEASTIVDTGRRNAAEVGRRIQDEARQEGAAMVERARREIQLAADAAKKDVYDLAAELAVDVAGRIIRKELSAKEHKHLVDESLERMRAEDTKMN
jgi:F-type H+-transporting ATPase subunit b